MAKEFSIKGVLQFLGVDKSVQEIKKFDSAIAGMKVNADKIGKGASRIEAGFKPLVAGSAAVGAGLGLAIKEAADFEQAMANINSVNELTTEQFRALENMALQLGASTTFSAKEAAAGMFELTKAGLSVEQTLQAIPGVLAAAATEGLELAQASEIMVGVLQGQNLQMNEATRVADVLAKAANSTAAGIVDLGEAFKYANQLNSAGLLGFEDTAAALGILSNAGLKGSIAGTSLVAMFNQITKPSKDVQTAFGGMANMMDIFTDKTTGKMKDLPELIEIIGKAADKQGNDFRKMAFLTDFVGVEGAKAFSALRRAVTAKDPQGRPMFQGLRQDLEDASGTALQVAMKRLDTTSGVFKLIGHEISTVGIMIGKIFLPELKKAATEVVGVLRSIAKTFIALQKTKAELTAEDMNYLNSPMGRFISGFIEGVKEAIDIFKSAWGTISSTLQTFGIMVGGSEQETGRLIGKLLVLATAILPLVGILYAVILPFKMLWNIISGTWMILSAGVGIIRNVITLMQLLWPVIAGLGRVLLVFATGPVGIAIAAIAAVGYAAYELYQNWDYLMNWFKTASLGEIIVKTLLAPIRMALTPIMELIQWLMNTNLASSILGGTAGSIKGLASAISLIPEAAPITAMKQASPMVQAGMINQQAVEAQRMTGPMSSQVPTEVNVQQAPILLQIENITKLDGKELSRNMSKQSIENSERSGQSATNPKNRTLQINNGQFATGFGR